MTRIVALWLIAHFAKPIITALTAITTTVVGYVSVTVAWLAQIDPSTFDAVDAVIPVTGTGLILFAVRFLVNVYRESLDVTRSNLADEREDRAEDRSEFHNRIRDLLERNAELERQLLEQMTEAAHLRAQLAEKDRMPD